MKKVVSIVLAMMLVCALAGCGAKGETPSGGQSAMESLPSDATPAQIVIADFTDKVNSGEYENLEDLAAALVEGEHIPFAGASMPVEPGFLNGFTEEIDGFKEGVMFGPSIGSIPFIGYVFELEDSVKADDFIANLKEKADLRWNICTQADEMQAGSAGSKVCFVMSPAEFES